jgi:hypothetical protein
MKTKPILCPERLRRVPRQFSWIDQRLVRDRHIQGRSPRALALYLMLCTVADAQGTSYYSDATTRKILAFTPAELREARAELVAAGLVAYGEPFYQVLGLEPAPGAAPGQPLPAPAGRCGEVRSIGDVLRAMAAKAESGEGQAQ